jgi:DNA-binding FrmR family transcriptional regulator
MAADTKTQVLTRLAKIEGQIRGLQKMVETERDCAEVIHQLSAARKALDKVGFIILSHRMQDCMGKAGSAETMNEVLKLFLSLA